jgi:hypothetical protein
LSQVGKGYLKDKGVRIRMLTKVWYTLVKKKKKEHAQCPPLMLNTGSVHSVDSSQPLKIK